MTCCEACVYNSGVHASHCVLAGLPASRQPLITRLLVPPQSGAEWPWPVPFGESAEQLPFLFPPL